MPPYALILKWLRDITSKVSVQCYHQDGSQLEQCGGDHTLVRRRKVPCQHRWDQGCVATFILITIELRYATNLLIADYLRTQPWKYSIRVKSSTSFQTSVI